MCVGASRAVPDSPPPLVLSSSPCRWNPYGSKSKCKICKQSLHQEGIYCQTCAYSQGFCSMCGIRVMDTTFYNMSEGGMKLEHVPKATEVRRPRGCCPKG